MWCLVITKLVDDFVLDNMTTVRLMQYVRIKIIKHIKYLKYMSKIWKLGALNLSRC
jgi:hypothetical protein